MGLHTPVFHLFVEDRWVGARSRGGPSSSVTSWVFSIPERRYVHLQLSSAQLRARWRLTKSRGCSVARRRWPASSLLLEGFLFVWSCQT